jgi:hypothetical protein
MAMAASQSLRTDQGGPDGAHARHHTHGSRVAIPPYRSGRFRQPPRWAPPRSEGILGAANGGTWTRRNPSVLIRAVPMSGYGSGDGDGSGSGSQSLRTDQGGSDLFSRHGMSSSIVLSFSTISRSPLSENRVLLGNVESRHPATPSPAARDRSAGRARGSASQTHLAAGENRLLDPVIEELDRQDGAPIANFPRPKVAPLPTCSTSAARNRRQSGARSPARCRLPTKPPRNILVCCRLL